MFCLKLILLFFLLNGFEMESSAANKGIKMPSSVGNPRIKMPGSTANPIKTIFNYIDTNNDYSLSLQEYYRFYVLSGLSVDMAKKKFTKGDTNCDKLISFTEFKANF